MKPRTRWKPRWAPTAGATGAGSGMGRCHLDVEIEAATLDPVLALDQLRAVLAELGVEACATLNVSD
ncbi:hypothetical protein ACWEO4_35445 [Streptomyces sp. NPDC004393]|uniref:hypothetical protein n=1 Tax=Streptomyces sp. NPDC004533 TaxID=3154278 RepID=UPI0033A42648